MVGMDDVAIPIVFPKGDLRKLAGRPVRVRFTLSNAQLFGFHEK